MSFLGEAIPTTWVLETGDDAFAWCSHAWWLLDGDLLRPALETRGENERVPGVPGRRELRRLSDERTEVLQVLFTGNCDPEGDPASNPVVQLEANKDAFLDAVVTGERSIAATLKGPRTYAGVLQVVRVRFGRGDFETTAAVTVTLPRELELDEGS